LDFLNKNVSCLNIALGVIPHSVSQKAIEKRCQRRVNLHVSLALFVVIDEETSLLHVVFIEPVSVDVVPLVIPTIVFVIVCNVCRVRRHTKVYLNIGIVRLARYAPSVLDTSKFYAHVLRSSCVLRIVHGEVPKKHRCCIDFHAWTRNVLY